MNFRKLSAGICALLVAASSQAGEEQKVRIEITFIDGSDLHDGEYQAGGTHQIRIIKKEVDVTN